MLSNALSNSLNQQISVTTSARLHLGFFDLTDQAGSRFGGLGMAIDAPCTQVQIGSSKNLVIEAKNSENVANIVEKLIKALNLPNNFSVRILQGIPEHAGLGSGTQMALALGAGLNQLFDLNLSVAQIAASVQRGRRSGIGIATFQHGGILVDGGRNETAGLPAIIARESFPSAWRVLLVQDSAHMGVHGAAEVAAFAKLKPAQHHLRGLVLQQMLPALQRGDLRAFGSYMQDLQAYNGDYFAPIQGGRYASEDVADVLAWLQTNGAACVGQSSWGPTGFAILEHASMAKQLKTEAQQAFAAQSNLSFSLCCGNNRGAQIERK